MQRAMSRACLNDHVPCRLCGLAPFELSGGREPADDAFSDLGHALTVEWAGAKKEVWQARSPADDNSSDRPGATVKQAKSRVDEAQRRPYDNVAEQLGASPPHGLDLPGHTLHQSRLVTATDDEALIATEQPALVPILELLAGADLRVDDPHSSRCHGNVIDVAPGAGLAAVVQCDDSGNSLKHFSDHLFPLRASRPGLNVLGHWLHPRHRGERRLETTGEWSLRLDPNAPLPIGRYAMLLTLAVPLGSSRCLPGNRPTADAPLNFPGTNSRLDLAG